MRTKVFFLTLILVLIASGSPAITATRNCSGHWEGSCLFSTVDVYVSQLKDGKITGVAYVKELFGGKTPYHFKGTFMNGVVVASHHSGHTFKGRMVSRDEIKGKLTTASKKYTFSLDATRTKK